MYLALIGFSLYISYIDLKTHRISNKSLLLAFPIFLALTLIDGSSLNPRSALSSALLAPILMKAKVGAGDLKLLILLAYFFLPCTLFVGVQFLTAFSLGSLALILQSGMKHRNLQSSIALAPAICGAVIWCAR